MACQVKSNLEQDTMEKRTKQAFLHSQRFNICVQKLMISSLYSLCDRKVKSNWSKKVFPHSETVQVSLR
jgi:hypothetical protein